MGNTENAHEGELMKRCHDCSKPREHGYSRCAKCQDRRLLKRQPCFLHGVLDCGGEVQRRATAYGDIIPSHAWVCDHHVEMIEAGQLMIDESYTMES